MVSYSPTRPRVLLSNFFSPSPLPDSYSPTPTLLLPDSYSLTPTPRLLLRSDEYGANHTKNGQNLICMCMWWGEGYFVGGGGQGYQVGLQSRSDLHKMKSVTFPNHFSVHSGSPNHTNKTDLKKSEICPI